MHSEPIRTYIIKALKEKGYTGLYNGEVCNEGCGCSIDDLSPCECLNLDECKPAYKIDCVACPIYNEDNYCWVGEEMKNANEKYRHCFISKEVHQRISKGKESIEILKKEWDESEF